MDAEGDRCEALIVASVGVDKIREPRNRHVKLARPPLVVHVLSVCVEGALQIKHASLSALRWVATQSGGWGPVSAWSCCIGIMFHS